MANEIEKRGSRPPVKGNELNNYGDGAQIGHVETMNATYNMVLVGNGGSHPGPDYYNLFVIGDFEFDPFKTDHFVMMSQRAVTECGYTNEETMERFTPLTAENLSELKKYPALITRELSDRTGKGCLGVYAVIKDIRRTQNGYKVYYQRLFPVDMERVVKELFDFGIYNVWELTHTHWAVKQTDILEAMQDNGMVGC